MNVQAQKNSMIDIPLQLLGGLSPAQFMRRHWQKKPLLIRNAISQFRPLLTDKELLALAANENVESRLLQQNGKKWELTHGPLPKLPPLQQKGWTALLQGMDAQHEAVRALLDQFRFLPDARLDDVMISYASEGGGVGPHFDSYDVFLLQAAGRRRWQISAQDDLRLRKNLPLKILQKFVPDDLPWAHLDTFAWRPTAKTVKPLNLRSKTCTSTSRCLASLPATRCRKSRRKTL